MWEQFFESYSEDIKKKMPKRDKGNFEMYRNNTKFLMEELKFFLENN
jgi:hypothetical protein